MKQRIVASVGLIMLVSIFLITTPTPTMSAKFVLASWDFPDEYGQGIEEVKVYENISGVWESLTPFGLLYTDATGLEINWTATGIQIYVKCWLNNTVVGADNFEDGKNYLNHSVILTMMGDLSNEIVFSKEGFTYDTGTDSLDPMFYYIYKVEMPFTPIGGQTYVAVVYYTILWGE